MTTRIEWVVVLLGSLLAGCTRSEVSDIHVTENLPVRFTSFQVEVSQEASCHASQIQIQMLRSLLESRFETLGLSRIDGKEGLRVRFRLTEFSGDVPTEGFYIGCRVEPAVARYKVSLEDANGGEWGSFRGTCADLSSTLGLGFEGYSTERFRLIERCAEQVAQFIRERGCFSDKHSLVE